MTRALKRRPTAATALSGFAAYVLGMLFVMASTFAMIAGVVMTVEGPWGGWLGRTAGVAFLLVGGAVFACGRWLMLECSVQQAPRG